MYLCVCFAVNIMPVFQLGAPLARVDPAAVSTGDLVRVELEPDVFQAVQEGRGGWSDVMLEVYTTHAQLFRILFLVLILSLPFSLLSHASYPSHPSPPFSHSSFSLMYIYTTHYCGVKVSMVTCSYL